MKKLLTLLLVLTLCIAIFTGCSKADFDIGSEMPGSQAPDSSTDNAFPEAPSEGGMMVAPSGSQNATQRPNYTYDQIKETGFVSTVEQASSFFSLDRNTANYSTMRKQINLGLTVNGNSVRLEEYVNYFNYNYARPTDGQPLAISGSIFDTPYNSQTKLFTIGVASEKVTFESVKPNNIVFLIDTSGSMYGEDRLGLIQQSFTMLLDYLGENDTVSIVTYASGVRVALPATSAKEKATIANALQDLQASGSTNGAGGIQLAYQVAQENFITGGNNRVILATDGDFNVGISDKEQLKQFITGKRNTGIYLSVLGVGMYNTNDAIMSTLATNGNGNYAYLDSVQEAYKVLVKELDGTFNVVAKDAKIGVTFNSDVVQSYRLVGYESKTMTEEEFIDQNKDAGEIGSGHTVTAVYEIVLKDNKIQPDLTVANVQLKCKHPDTDEQIVITKVFSTNDYTTTPTEDNVFIGCVVEYGLVLRQSQYKCDANLANVIARLERLQCVIDDTFKAEFLTLVQKANAIEFYSNQSYEK